MTGELHSVEFNVFTRAIILGKEHLIMFIRVNDKSISPRASALICGGPGQSHWTYKWEEHELCPDWIGRGEYEGLEKISMSAVAIGAVFICVGLVLLL